MNEHVLVRQSLDQAVADIAALKVGDWAGQVVYLLESLSVVCAKIYDVSQRAYWADEDNPENFFNVVVLEKVVEAIETRLKGGSW